jgi:hypothetical protein
MDQQPAAIHLARVRAVLRRRLRTDPASYSLRECFFLCGLRAILVACGLAMVASMGLLQTGLPAQVPLTAHANVMQVQRNQ